MRTALISVRNLTKRYGEVLAVSGLVEEMRRCFPQCRVLVSTTTDTGQALARKRFGEKSVFYFPLDFAFAIRPYLRALQPELVVLAETEFWPNFLRLSHASGARIAVVNARISNRSWPSYRLARQRDDGDGGGSRAPPHRPRNRSKPRP